ncbi:hypothetical protein H257_02275 [Aphanomyces astaci]|uniref:Helicase-associated domain-containing protein n=1 Tax=Aphanomyces astaci TaxID=112090 RepID=W4H196_APHAT|nr:hypothetical protein H257_02275 [Aphanomyces astaci]ETV85662.1 hypothetical protein H257_02275 [Aphanomyces astaci]|eukprot:XP_009824134.1 hypothetical protein H257_02275 [Aphanomyces astaci]
MGLAPTAPHAMLLEVVQIARSIQSSTSDYVNFPARFTVPDVTPWPKSLRGRTIQVARVRRQFKDGVLPTAVVEALNNVGFVWDAKQHNWTLRVLALKTYKSLYHNLLVPYEFTVPPHAATWSRDLWGCKLGVAVTNIRSRAHQLPPDRKAELDALGFVWDSHELTFDIKVLALNTYKQLHGHVHVPFEFKVPDTHPSWPPTCWKLKLGRAVHDLRCRGDHLTPERRDVLDALGFVWDSHELNWDMKLQALATFKQVFGGTLVVPQDFVVPSTAPWPQRSWSMKLGQAVTNMRFRADSMSAERHAQLEAIGFIWDYPELRVDAGVLLQIKSIAACEFDKENTNNHILLGSSNEDHINAFNDDASSNRIM